MKRKPNHYIYSKLLFFITFASIFFLLLFLSLYLYTDRQERQTYQNSQKQFNAEIASVLKLNSEGPTAVLNSLTSWAGLSKFTVSKDKKWFIKNIMNNLGQYDFEFIEVYDLDGNPILNNKNSKIKSEIIIPKEALLPLKKNGFTNFYIKTSEGYMKIFATSINDTNDTLKKHSGYLLAGRLLNKKFIDRLEKNSNATIKIINPDLVEKSNGHSMVYSLDLKDWKNTTIAKLTLTRTLNLAYNKTQNILIIIILSCVIFIVIFIYYCKIWFFSPLNTITEILETGNKKHINTLKIAPGEFAHIGNLFDENRTQKLELVKAKLKAEENDRLKSSFLSNLSHEIRTPMNAILGFTDLLMNTETQKEEQNKYLKVIDRSGRNLISIIDDLIEMSKIDSNQITPNITSINLESCIRELYETIKITIKKSKKIEFFILESKSPARYNINTDEIKLKEIIVNLVTNAIKFTDEGYVAFGYEVIEEKKQIKFTVKDTGYGIDEENQNHIFDRFRRVGEENSIKAGGLGLGLSISKAYTEMLGGSIELESKIGKGSIFSFTIPLIYSIEKIDEDYLSDKKLNPKENEKGTILIAEDNNINFLLLQKILKDRNYKILRATDGQKAIDICSDNSEIDLVLMDIKMPVMDGFETFQKIQEIRPNLPVIAQTAFSSNEDKEKVLKLGFNDYITKPINREKLIETVDRVLKKEI
jgi:signal transduction histidine kinase/CheY-like chemotaxis protein